VKCALQFAQTLHNVFVYFAISTATKIPPFRAGFLCRASPDYLKRFAFLSLLHAFSFTQCEHCVSIKAGHLISAHTSYIMHFLYLHSQYLHVILLLPSQIESLLMRYLLCCRTPTLLIIPRPTYC